MMNKEKIIKAINATLFEVNNICEKILYTFYGCCLAEHNCEINKAKICSTNLCLTRYNINYVTDSME